MTRYRRMGAVAHTLIGSREGDGVADRPTHGMRSTSGGWYELALELEGLEAARVDVALRTLERLAGIEPVAGGGVLRLPDEFRVVCDQAVVQEDSGSVWVVLGLPLGALSCDDPQVGGYPSGERTGAAWRRPLDAWLVSLAVHLFDVAPFSLALVGFEVSGELSAAQLVAVRPPSTSTSRSSPSPTVPRTTRRPPERGADAIRFAAGCARSGPGADWALAFRIADHEVQP